MCRVCSSWLDQESLFYRSRPDQFQLPWSRRNSVDGICTQFWGVNSGQCGFWTGLDIPHSYIHSSVCPSILTSVWNRASVHSLDCPGPLYKDQASLCFPSAGTKGAHNHACSVCFFTVCMGGFVPGCICGSQGTCWNAGSDSLSSRLQRLNSGCQTTMLSRQPSQKSFQYLLLVLFLLTLDRYRCFMAN